MSRISDALVGRDPSSRGSRACTIAANRVRITGAGRELAAPAAPPIVRTAARIFKDFSEKNSFN